MFKSFPRIAFCSLLLFLILSPLRGYVNFQTCSLIGFILYFCLTVFLLKRFSQQVRIWKIIIALIVGIWILQIPIRIVDFNGSLISLPDSLLQTSGIIFGLFYFLLKKPLNILAAALGCSIIVFMFFQGYYHWFHYLNYGTFTGGVSYSPPAKFEVFDEEKNLINEESLKGKIIVLDFWFSACGSCFRKFPQVQKLHEKYKNDSSVIVIAVNNPIEQDKIKSAFAVIREEGYSFPVVIAKDEQTLENFGVNFFPTTLVIGKSGTVIFKGDVGKAESFIEFAKQAN